MEKEFNVYIVETLSRHIIIKADSVEDAYSKAEEMYSDQDIVLDASDFVGYDIEVEE